MTLDEQAREITEWVCKWAGVKAGVQAELTARITVALRNAIIEARMTSNEEAVLEAAIEWANLREGARYVPMELRLRKAEKALEDAVSDMMGDRT